MTAPSSQCPALNITARQSREDDDDGMAPGQSSPIITIQRPGWCDQMVGANEEPNNMPLGPAGDWMEFAQGSCPPGGLPPCAIRSRISKAARQQLQLMLRCEPTLAPVHSSTCVHTRAARAQACQETTERRRRGLHSQANANQQTTMWAVS